MNRASVSAGPMPAPVSARTASARSSRQVMPSLAAELLGAFVGRECLDHIVELPFEHAIERVQGDRDAMIGEPVLLVVVGADLLGTPATLHLVTPCRTHLGVLTILFRLQQTRAQDAHRFVLVLKLTLLVLARHDETRRLVRDPNRGIGRG